MKNKAASRIAKAFRNWRIRKYFAKIRTGLRLSMIREKMKTENAFRKWERCMELFKAADVIIEAKRAKQMREGFERVREQIVQKKYHKFGEKLAKKKVIREIGKLGRLRV